MTTRRLLLNSIRHYWRTHLGVILGSALAALVLTGALMVGDSVKATLRAQAEARVGKIGEALLCGERFVPWPHVKEHRPSVVARTFVPGPDAAGVLMLSGTAARSDGKARANKVQIVGVDDAFWKLSPSGNDPFASDATNSPAGKPASRASADGKHIVSGSAGVPPADSRILRESSDDRTPSVSVDGRATRPLAGGTPALPDATSIALNERLAAQLGVQPGDEVLLRLEKPSAFSKDAPLSGEDEGSIALRVPVARVVGDADFGRFALTSGQVPPFTAFVPLAVLQEKLGLGEKVNVAFNAATAENSSSSRSGLSAWKQLQNAMGWTKWRSQGTNVPNDLRSIDIQIDDLAFPEGAGRHLPDFGIKVIQLPQEAQFEVRSPRVFLDTEVVAAARRNENAKARPHLTEDTEKVAPPMGGLDSLTYFVNELRAGDGNVVRDFSRQNGEKPADAQNAKPEPDAQPTKVADYVRATPYSMVTAIDAAASGFANPKLADDEIQITRWLADDLGVAPGAKVTVKYFVMGERRQLVEKARTFTVAAPILEMTEPQLNSSWMPDFPGLADKANCRDWKPGFDFDATRMRDKDQDYWTKFRGTPKAFVTLKTGQELWGNRWGNLTSIRYPAGTKREQVERIAAFIDPAALGFRTVNLREQALAATNAPVDFGQLFVYFSFFLIAAAAVLTGLLFTFTIEQRAAEAGLLLAVGWPVKRVRRLFLREGFVLALIGSLAGALLAALYTKGVLHALAGVWGGATGGTRFVFAPSAITIAIGVVSGVLVALIAMWLASRRLFKMEAAILLNGESAADGSGTAGPAVGVGQAASPVPAPTQDRRAACPTTTGGPPVPRRRAGRLLVFTSLPICLCAAVALAVFGRGNPGAFFGAGALLLIAGCLFSLVALRRVADGKGAESIAQLGTRNISRRRGRSLATIAVLASGVFMVIAVDSFRKGAPEDSARRDSGTGGFAFIGESSAPIYEDLNSAKGREAYALDDKLMSGVRVVQMRVRDGDDASCLNLNKAAQPRLLGVNADELATLKAFGFADVGDWFGSGEPANEPVREKTAAACWKLLDDQGHDDGAAAGIVDANSLQWALKKKIGETIEYPGERGEPVSVRFVASLASSVLQGNVLIAEQQFVKRFPNTAGTRFFLVDCPREKMDAVREHLTRQLGDRGLELVPAVKRLAEFNEVENTYLSIFQVLGGLGMLLGSAGLGIVVARNVFERRREFGLLEAVGFTPRLLRRLVFAEHRWLIVGAVAIGAVSALTAVWPRLVAQSSSLPWRGVGGLIGGMALLGAFWAWLATRIALRRSQLAALRTE